MILPISTSSTNLNILKNSNNKKQYNNNLSCTPLRLSGYTTPMKSYVSFGYCERDAGHYAQMFKIDSQFAEKMAEKIQQVEKLQNIYQRRLSLEEESNVQAARLMMQYSNMQTIYAEMPPAYTIVTGTKLKEVMNKTQTFTNPISNLITINNITKISGKNPNLPEHRKDKATRSAQLYSTLLLLDQIKQYKDQPQYTKTRRDIEELTQTIESTIKAIYGDDILERVEKLGKMGRTVSLENQKMALDFLVEIDCVAKDLKLPSEFEEKLSKLIEKQNEIDSRTIDIERPEMKLSKTIQVFYHDHDHAVSHSHIHSHMGEHHHHHHDSEEVYSEIVKKH